MLLAWLAEVDRAGAGYVNPEAQVTYADEYVGKEEQTWADSAASSRPPEDGAGAAAAFETPTREEQKDIGLEVITREEYEDRLRTGAKDK